MKAIEFRGHSDDTFGFDMFVSSKGKLYEQVYERRVDGDDHDDYAMNTVRAYRVASPSTGATVIVTGVFNKCPGATWAIGISPNDEGVAIPEWATRPHFRTDGRTPVMTLMVPDDTTVKLVCVDGLRHKENP